MSARQPAKRQYPSREERERIVQRRGRLMRALIEAISLRGTNAKQADAQISALVSEHGPVEVERILSRLKHQFERPRKPDVEEAWLYAEYVKLHQRFGGTRPLLAAHELETLRTERARLGVRRDFLHERLSPAEKRRFAEIGDLILADSDLWDDLVPDDPPPAQRQSPPSQKLGRNAPCWCGSGRKYKHCHWYVDEAR
jgi:hypothetical protein